MTLVQKEPKKIYILSEEKKREPGTSTYAYWKLNSTTQLQDSSGNGHTLTNGGSATFGTYQGVSCCYLAGSYLSAGSDIKPGTQKTVLAWVYIPSADTNKYIWLSQGSPASSALLGGSTPNINYNHPNSAGTSTASNSTTYVTGWNLVATTNNSNTHYLYVYNSSNQNRVSGAGMAKDFSGLFTIGMSTSGYSLVGYVSEFIIESAYFSKDDIDTYFNQTKSTYGL